MSEERFPGELPESRASSLKIVFALAGFVVAAGVLLCGGVAAYVAWIDPVKPVVETVSPDKDPASIRQVADKIAVIDIPAGFEPISSEAFREMSHVAFGRAADDGALLKLGRMDLTHPPPSNDLSQRQSMLQQMIEMGKPRTRTTFLPGSVTAETTRELTVLGQPVLFRFLRGIRAADQPKTAKVMGSFRTNKALIILIFTIPETEYDEDAVVKMIESIRPAHGDSAPDEDAANDGKAEGDSGHSGKQPEKSEPPKDAATGNRASAGSASAAPGSP